MSEPMNAEDMHRALMAKRWYEWGFKRIWRWWIVVASIVVPLRIIEWVWGYDFTGSNKIHTALLQILGVVFFLVGIMDTLKRFKKPGAIERVVAWAKEIPLVKRHYVMAAGTGILSSFGATGHGRVWTPPDEAKSIELRVKALEKNQESLLNEIDQTYREQQAANLTLKTSVEEERRDREAQVGLVSGLLEQTTVGGVDDLYLAAALTFISTLLSTVGPNRLEPWFRTLHLF